MTLVTKEQVDLSRRFRLVFTAPIIRELPAKEVTALRNALATALVWESLSQRHQELLLHAEKEIETGEAIEPGALLAMAN